MTLLPIMLGNDEIKEAMSSKECFSLVFPIQPIVGNLEDYFIPEYSYIVTASVAIITGIDKQGESFVVLGKRKEDVFKSAIKSGYTFSGGLKSMGESFSACAIREAAEELGVPELKSCVKNITCIYTYEDAYHHIKFYHIDVGNSLAERSVYAQDDFLLARKVSFKSISFSEDYQGTIGPKSRQLFLKKSTALLLRELIYKGMVNKENDLIRLSLLIEYERSSSEELFIENLKEGDLVSIQTFVSLGFEITPSVMKEALVVFYGSSEESKCDYITHANEIIKILMGNLKLKDHKQTHFDFFTEPNHEEPCFLSEVWELLKPNDITASMLDCLIAYGLNKQVFSSRKGCSNDGAMLEFIKNPNKTEVIRKILLLGYSVLEPYELYLSAIIDFESKCKEEDIEQNSAIKENIETIRVHYKIDIPRAVIDLFKHCQQLTEYEINNLKNLLFEHNFCLESIPASKELDEAVSKIINGALCNLRKNKCTQSALNAILDVLIEIKFPSDNLYYMRYFDWEIEFLQQYKDRIDVDSIKEKLSTLVKVSTSIGQCPRLI